MPTRVFIVDEQHLLRQGLRSLLSQHPDYAVVGDASEGKGALQQALTLAPDVVLMSIALPGLNGIEVTAQLKRQLPRTSVVLMADPDSGERLRESLRVGTDGYLLKGSSYEELLEALHSVVAGRKYLSPAVSGQLVDGFLNPRAGTASRSPLQQLTARERSILQLIAEGRTNRGAAEFLNVSHKTVEKHRASLMRKLGLRSASELLLAALDLGMIERPGAVSRLVNRHMP